MKQSNNELFLLKEATSVFYLLLFIHNTKFVTIQLQA